MIVSTAMAVLPVPRSPMISSRWPRPIGIMASMALMPVWSGSFTGWRTMMPGATISTWRVVVAWIVPRPSTGRPSASTTRPSMAGADGHLEQAAGAADLVAFLELEVVAEDGGADVVLFEVEHQARHRLARLRRGELEHLARDGRLQAVNARDAVAHLEHGADLGHVGGRNDRPRRSRGGGCPSARRDEELISVAMA